MGEITIIEKPDWITYDDIHDLLYDAHGSNREKGFNVNTAVMNGKELEEHLGQNGKTLVAMDGDKMVGTVSYRTIYRENWCIKGEVGDIILLGVLPEYKGKHIASTMTKRVREELLASGCHCIEVRTAEENESVQKLSLKNGYRYVDFVSSKTDHYTVVMMKWFDECPYSLRKTNWHFKMKRFLIKLRFKPGKIKRFGI